MTYGLKDLAAPFIQHKGTLGECYRQSKGMGLCGLYRRENDGWSTVAVRYWSKFTHISKIKTI